MPGSPVGRRSRRSGSAGGGGAAAGAALGGLSFDENQVFNTIQGQTVYGVSAEDFLGITVQNSSPKLRFQYPRSIYLQNRLNTDTSVWVLLYLHRPGSEKSGRCPESRTSFPQHASPRAPGCSGLWQPVPVLINARVYPGLKRDPRAGAERQAAAYGILNPQYVVEFHFIGQYLKQM